MTTILAGARTSSQLSVNMDPISEVEVRLAIKQSKNGKATGVDNIQPEFLKTADSIIPHLTRVCNIVWQHEVTPVDSRMGIIFPLPKKGDQTNCSNWRGITLSSVPGKVFARILLNRMKDAVDQLFRQQQAGFRPRRSCMDQIYLIEANNRKSIRKSTSGNTKFRRLSQSL